MSTETQEDVSHQSLRCCWPELFTKRRDFNRHTENQPYIKYCGTPLFYGEEHEDEDDEDDDEDGISSEDDDPLNKPEDEVEGHRDTLENQDETLNDDKGSESCNRYSNIRCFMTGMIGDEDSLEDHDQVDEVASFCEQPSFRENDSKSGQKALDGKHVALLDDMNIGGTIVDKKGHCRPYLEPLTWQELCEKLSKRRFRVESEQTAATNAFEDEESDAERRLVFIPDLDPLTIEAIVTTASLTQAPALRNLFYKHLTSKTSIGVTIPSHGFRIFTLDFHMPYYVLKIGKELLKDTRKKFNGEPLRQSRELPFLSRPMNVSKSTDGHHCLYEAQISVIVTGIDHWVWAAYGFVDTYFGSKETADSYHRLKGRFGGRADPLAAGELNADEPIWTPREYFLKVVEIRMKQVLKEWNRIVRTVEKEIKWSRLNHIFPLACNDPENTAKVWDFSIWNTQMMALLTQLISGLSETVQAWQEFRRTDIGYFLYDGEIPTASSSLKPSLVAVDKEFSKLRLRLWKLEDLEKELCKGSPQGLHAHLSLENNAAATFQQKAARQLEDLTVITIIFFPLALAANLFSATGVLPFTPNLVKFIYAFLILGVSIVAILIVLSNWRFWLQQVVDYAQKAITYYNERLRRNGIRRDAHIISPKTLKQKIFSRRPQKATLPMPWDIENGAEKAKAG